jgi:hypothetical protein
MAEFIEDEHPRDEIGRFADKDKAPYVTFVECAARSGGLQDVPNRVCNYENGVRVIGFCVNRVA